MYKIIITIAIVAVLSVGLVGISGALSNVYAQAVAPSASSSDLNSGSASYATDSSAGGSAATGSTVQCTALSTFIIGVSNCVGYGQ